MEYKNRRINENTNPDRILLNQKMVNEYRGFRENQKSSKKAYCRGKSVTRTKLGKLVCLCMETSETGTGKILENEDFQNMAEKKNAVEQNQGSINKERLLHLLEENSLTGMSGNGFGVKDKLEALSENPRVLLVNGVECEPGLLHDEWLLQNFEEEISQGMDFLCQCIPFERRILACKVLRKDRKEYRKERKDKREYGKERREKREYRRGYKVCNVPAVYPMGEEHLLIRQVLGEELNREERPSDAGILVMNVQTVYQIYCLITGQYQSGRFVTLTDLATGKAKVVYVRRGEKIKDTLKKYFPKGENSTFFAGAGIMGAHSVIEGEVFTDQISFAAVGNPVPITNANACKGCGRCNHKCPAGVDIRGIVKIREKNPKADISNYGIENCIHCKSCTFFCRAGKNIQEYLTV